MDSSSPNDTTNAAPSLDGTGDACIDPFLIIAGVPKAGTTSLFSYLATHPGICACSYKEPWYFLTAGVGLRGRPHWVLDPLARYLDLFPGYSPGKVRLEASTSYFAYTDVADRLAAALPNSKVVVLLRDPIDRLISHFRFGRHQGWIPYDEPFDQFVTQAASSEFRFMLDLGLYARPLRHWRDVLGGDRLLVLWHDELATAPREVTARVLRFAGLNPDLMDDKRAFTVENLTLEPRSTRLWARYARLKAALRRRNPDSTILRWGRAVRDAVWPIARRWLLRADTGVRAQPHTMQWLLAFYRDDVAETASAIGAPPWADRYAQPPR